MDQAIADVFETNLIVNGDWVPAAGGQRYEVRNPARPSEVVGQAARADASDVNAAMEAAHAAFPSWSALTYAERAEYLRAISNNLVDDENALKSRIKLFTREHGKVLKESGIEMTRLGDRFDLFATYADRLAQDDELSGPPFDSIITRQAFGVALLIVPWNWPLSILGAKLPQALVAGNTVVIKIANEAPLAPALAIQKMAEVLPKGVINLITGRSSEIGDALLGHPYVRRINFTGSIAAGRYVMAKASEGLKPVTLELGGNDPALIMEDADLDDGAFQRMVMGTFLTSGQICMALKRLYVHRSRYEEVVDRFTALAGRAIVGDGLDPEVTMGPVNNAAQHEIIANMVAEATSRGATVTPVGTVKDKDLFQQGYFHRPTIVTNADHDLLVVREEQFGPVLPILPFDTEAEAIALANDSDYGLCSSVWSADRDRAVRIARQLESGYTYLNGHGPMAQDSRAPFGGFKNSGIGRNLGYEGILEFQQYHSISGAPGFLFS
ncbi:MAG: aldehyde dehydrogenase family protein [Pseudomonadota bacterium]